MAKTLIEPRVALALSLLANRGAYALLIGSGVSRAARIPTGWEVTLDLIRKLSVVQAVDCAADPATWYRTTYGAEPDYSDLLNQLGKTPEERNQLLRGYFEPSEEERGEGWKQPTKAHRAIAELVVQGYVKIILTTNFDRLLELAIQDAGVTPTVISTPEGIAGSLPLIHQRCCVVKLHGDYLDTRIKNTPEELATYHDAVDKLLDRVFDEFGLIVCGWSGVWDTALRAAIDRCPSRRFTTYWASVGDPAREASELIQRRAGQIVRIKDANTFFQDLSDKTQSLESSLQPHPLSTAAAVASLKRFIAEDRYNIRLRDLLSDEAERVYGELAGMNKQLLGRSIKTSDIPGIYGKYREISTTLIELFVHGCFWSRPTTDSFFAATLQQVCRQAAPTSGAMLNSGFLHYPALLHMYAGGIAAVGAGKYTLLANLFNRPRLLDGGKAAPLILALDWSRLTECCTAEFPNERKYYPVSEHMFLVLEERLRQYYPDNGELEDNFDRYEYLQTLVVADAKCKEYGDTLLWGPMGRFAWKARRRVRSTIDRIAEEAQLAGADWPPIRAGLFDGSIERFDKARIGINERMSKLQGF